MMNKFFRVLGFCFALGYLIYGPALAVGGGTARSGDVVTVAADCEYSLGLGDPDSEPASTDFALASPLRDEHQSPLYLAQGWQRNDGLAAGMIVRAYVVMDGRVELADGVQLSDGRVMVDGEILQRAGP
jgi:hypothetical protein